MLDVITDDNGRVSVMVELPEDPPPSNYIPMEPRMLVNKLTRRQNYDHTGELLQLLSTRAGLRCSLRWAFPLQLRHTVQLWSTRISWSQGPPAALIRCIYADMV